MSALGEHRELLAGVETGYLPASLEVQLAEGVRDVAALSPLVARLRSTAGVEEVERSYDAWAERPLSFAFAELRGPKSARMIGIDLGTAFTCAAYVAGGKAQVIPGEHGKRSFPSAVWIDGTRYLVGESAIELVVRGVLEPSIKLM